DDRERHTGGMTPPAPSSKAGRGPTPLWAREPVIGGFGVSSLARFGLLQLAARVMPKKSPLWSNDETSNRPVEPGLWAIEPHLGGTGFGAKFEELLVVEPGGRAFWLDDDLPHVKPLQTPTSKG